MPKVNFKISPISAVKMYDQLREDWIAKHPNHTESDLQKVCVSLAKSCRLNLKKDLKNEFF